MSVEQQQREDQSTEFSGQNLARELEAMNTEPAPKPEKKSHKKALAVSALVATAAGIAGGVAGYEAGQPGHKEHAAPTPEKVDSSEVVAARALSPIAEKINKIPFGTPDTDIIFGEEEGKDKRPLVYKKIKRELGPTKLTIWISGDPAPQGQVGIGWRNNETPELAEIGFVFKDNGHVIKQTSVNLEEGYILDRDGNKTALDKASAEQAAQEIETELEAEGLA